MHKKIIPLVNKVLARKGKVISGDGKNVVSKRNSGVAFTKAHPSASGLPKTSRGAGISRRSQDSGVASGGGKWGGGPAVAPAGKFGKRAASKGFSRGMGNKADNDPMKKKDKLGY